MSDFDLQQIDVEVRKQLASKIEPLLLKLTFKPLTNSNFDLVNISSSAVLDEKLVQSLYTALGLDSVAEGKNSDTGVLRKLYLIPSLIVDCSNAVYGKLEQAVKFAAAMHFLLSASLIFDDIQDQDKTDSLSLVAKLGIGYSLNVGLILMLIGQELLNDNLEKMVTTPGQAVFWANRLSQSLRLALRGQILDVQESFLPLDWRLEQLDYYLIKSALKTAEWVSYMTVLGASCGASGHAEIEAYKKFGFAFGMTLHITNDLKDYLIANSDPNKSRDLNALQPTVPLALAYQELDSLEKRQQFVALWKEFVTTKDLCEESNVASEISQMLSSTSGFAQTISLALRYLVEAEEQLQIIDPNLQKKEHQKMLNTLKGLITRF